MADPVTAAPEDARAPEAPQISLVHRGAHATGPILVSPLFADFAARSVFGAAALAIPLVGLTCAAVAARAAHHRAENLR